MNWNMFWAVVALLLGAMFIGGGILFVLSTIRSAATREERAAEAAETARRAAEAASRAAEATAHERADQRRQEAFLATVQTPQADRLVRLVTTRLGGYERVEAILDPSKRFLETADAAAALCKEVRLSSPGCASLHIGPGRDVILAGRGLSHDPLHGNPLEDKGKWANLVAVFAAANQQSEPASVEEGSSEPVNGTKPPAVEAGKKEKKAAPDAAKDKNEADLSDLV